MPTVFLLSCIASLGLMAFSTALAAEPPDKLALSSSEVNLLEVDARTTTQSALYAAFYSGSAADPRGREGLAWVTAALIARQAAEAIEVTVTRDMTLFTIGALAGRDEAMRALSRAILKPAFTPEMLETIRQQGLSELDAIRQEPARLAVESFHAYVHAGHPYGHPPFGTFSGLQAITPDDVLAFHAGHYLKGNLAIAVPYGTAAQLLARIRSDLAGIPNGEPIREGQAVTWLPRPGFLVVESANAPPGGMILAGHPTSVTVAHPDYFSLRAALLGVVERSGEMLPSPHRQPVILLSAGGTSGGGVDALGGLLAAFRQVAAAGFSADQMEAIRVSMRAPSVPLVQEARSPLLSRLEEFLDRSPGMAARQVASVDQVSGESVRSAAARHLHAGRLAIIAVVASSDRFVAEILASPAMKETGVPPDGSTPTRNDFTLVKDADLFR